MEVSGPLEGDRAATKGKHDYLSNFAGAELGHEHRERGNIASSLAVPRALSTTCLNLPGSKRTSRSSPLPRTDRRYTQSTVVGRVGVCTPLICSESSLHHVFAYNFLRLHLAYNFPRLQIAYNVQGPPAAARLARLHLCPPGLPRDSTYRLCHHNSLSTHHVFAPPHATDHSRRLERCKDAICSRHARHNRRLKRAG